MPLPHTDEEDDSDQVLMLDVMEDPPITTVQVKQWTAKDKTLSQVLLWCLTGWPKEIETQFKPYSKRQLELSVRDGCVTLGVESGSTEEGKERHSETIAHHTPRHIQDARLSTLLCVVARYGL